MSEQEFKNLSKNPPAKRDNYYVPLEVVEMRRLIQRAKDLLKKQKQKEKQNE